MGIWVSPRGSTFTLSYCSIYLLTFIGKCLKICCCLTLPYLVFSLRPFHPSCQGHQQPLSSQVQWLALSSSYCSSEVDTVDYSLLLETLSSLGSLTTVYSQCAFHLSTYSFSFPPLILHFSGSNLQPVLFPTAMTFTSPVSISGLDSSPHTSEIPN